MATAEELLNTISQNQVSVLSEDDGIFVIDGESRTITVPDSERLFGVEGDKDVERKYFQCPKIVGDNIDLSQHQIYVSYVFTTTENNTTYPEENTGLYHCEDVETSGDNITFSWLLSGNVFANPGFIAFKVMAKKSEEDELKTKWNTAPAIGTVLITVPDGEDIAEEYPDVINQIFDRLDALESGGGGGTGGTTNYENLSNKPQLNGVTLEGNKTLDQVGVLAKNQGSSNSGKYLSVGSDGNVVPADAPSGGTVDPEQIKQAVNNYLEKNPVSGMTAEQEQQLSQNTTDITDLKSALPDKLDSNQGVENKGKSMVVGEDGRLVPEDVKVPVDNTFSNDGEAADAKATGEELSKKVDVEKEIDPEWEKWSDVRYNYGFDKNIQPIFNTIKGILETDTMISVRGGKGRWNKTDKPASEFVSGGHVFEGWSGKELARLTMLIGKFHEMFACIQTYSPAGLYQSTRRFGWVKLGSDEKNKGFDFSQGWSTCYTPLTFQPLSRPTTVMDYDLNPQFTSSTVPIGTLYYDKGENRFNVFTSNGWKSIAFTDDINNSNKEPTEPFSGNIEYTSMYPRKEDGIIADDTRGSYSAWFPVEASKSYKVTRSELTDRFRIYLYNSEDLDSAFSLKEPGFLVVEDANNNVLDSLVFTNNNTYKFALVLLDNEKYYSKSVTISVLTSKN